MIRLLPQLLLATALSACTTEVVEWVEPPSVEEPEATPSPDDGDDDRDDGGGRKHGKGKHGRDG